MSKRTPTEKQIHAARENGRKSHGPASEEGKTKSARNGIRHGMLANTIVIEGESRDRFMALLSGLPPYSEPDGEIESALMENIAVCRWRQMRIWAMEKAGLSHEIRKRSAEDTELAAHDAPTRAALAFRALCDNSRALEVL